MNGDLDLALMVGTPLFRVGANSARLKKKLEGKPITPIKSQQQGARRSTAHRIHRGDRQRAQLEHGASRGRPGTRRRVESKQVRNAAGSMVMLRALSELAAEMYAVALRNHLANLAAENARAAEAEKAQWAPCEPTQTTAQVSSTDAATADTATGKSAAGDESAAGPTLWLSQDPLGYVDSFSAYAFNKFDPVNFVDPWGLSSSGQGKMYEFTGQLETTVRGKREPACDSACKAELDRIEAHDRTAQRAQESMNGDGQLSRPQMSARMKLSMALRSAGNGVAAIQRYGNSYAKSWNEVFDLTGTEKVDPEALEKANVAIAVVSMGAARGPGGGPRVSPAGAPVGRSFCSAACSVGSGAGCRSVGRSGSWGHGSHVAGWERREAT